MRRKYVLYTNHYTCSECGTTWEDTWSCACNDHCPKCHAEIEPHTSTTTTVSADDLPKGVSPEDCKEV